MSRITNPRQRVRDNGELRNFTQSYLAKELKLSLSGYSKIERDETEVSIKRLRQIAKILDTDLATVLNFNSKQVFNQYNNKTANANGIVKNQKIISDSGMKELLKKMDSEITLLKEVLKNMQAEK